MFYLVEDVYMILLTKLGIFATVYERAHKQNSAAKLFHGELSIVHFLFYNFTHIVCLVL